MVLYNYYYVSVNFEGNDFKQLNIPTELQGNAVVIIV